VPIEYLLNVNIYIYIYDTRIINLTQLLYFLFNKYLFSVNKCYLYSIDNFSNIAAILQRSRNIVITNVAVMLLQYFGTI